MEELCDQNRKTKAENFTTVTTTDGKIKYMCKLCEQLLSSKQRILTHLTTVHNLSPIKRVKKQYVDDPTIPIPKRTLLRHSVEKRFEIAEENNWCNENTATTMSTETITTTNTESETTTSTDSSGMHLESNGLTQNSTNIIQENGDISHQNDFTLLESDMQTTNENLQSDSPIINEYSLDNSDESDDASSTWSNNSYKDSSGCDDSSSSESEKEEGSQMPENEELSILELQSMCLISYVIRHNLTGAAADDIPKLLKIFCPKNVDFSQLSYKKILERLSTNTPKCIHICTVCNKTFSDNKDNFECETPNCSGLRYKGKRQCQTKASRLPVSSFTIGDVQGQLRYLIMNKSNLESLLTTKDNVHNTMTEYEMKENFVIHDIVDGISYRELNKPGAFLSYRYAFSGIFNTDGIPLFSSTKEKLWPIFIAINEFPVSQRFCRENLILAGIWQGKGNPPFFQYISAFGQEMSKLYFDGFTLDNEDKILVKFGVLAGTLDLQAKGYVANMTMHNGAFGCITCEEEGRTVRQGKGTARCYPFRSEDEQKPIRAHMTFVNESLTANHQNRIKGICGPSGLIAMPWYDIIVGTVPDYMHGTLLGVTKHLLQKFLSPKNSNKPFFVGKNIQAISKRMTSIKPPDFVERVPRDLEKNYQNFKATELQAWLLYYSLPCLHGFLPDVYLKHLALLSEGIYILLSDNITSQDLQKAKENLSKFYKDFAILYGEGSSGLNVHNIGQHLVFYVQHWGPIFAWSCFGFEDANANILSFAHGTKDVTKQILGMKEAHMIVHSTSISPDTACGAFFKNMNKRFSKKWKHTQEMNNCSIAGAVKPFVLPNYSTSEFVNTFCNSTDISLLRSALRVEVNNEKYYGKDYTKMKTKVSYVALCEGGNIVEIQSFILNTVTNHVYALVLRLDISQQTFLYVAEGHHIMCVEKTNDVVILGVNKLKEKLFYMEVGNKKYVARVPNVHGRGVLK